MLVTATDADPTNPIGTQGVIAAPATASGEWFPFSVSWSPDGSHLLYVGWHGGGEGAGVIAVPIEGDKLFVALAVGAVRVDRGTPSIPPRQWQPTATTSQIGYRTHLTALLAQRIVVDRQMAMPNTRPTQHILGSIAPTSAPGFIAAQFVRAVLAWTVITARFSPIPVRCAFGHMRPQWIRVYGGIVTVDGPTRPVWADYA